MRVRPIILSGTDGGGLWPLARGQAPSHLQPIFGDRSPLQEAARSLASADLFGPPIVVAQAQHRFMAAQQLADIGVTPEAIILEPASRGALAATAFALAWQETVEPEAIVLIAPGDQAVRKADAGAFRRAVSAALPLAAAGEIVTFAAPARPWLKHRRAYADGLVDAGWLLAKASKLQTLIDAVSPELGACARRAVAQARADLDFLRLDAAATASTPEIDFQRLLDAAQDGLNIQAIDFTPVLARDWPELHAARRDAQDADGNIAEGDAILLESANCYVRSPDRLTTLAGVQDLAVIVTDDAILVANMKAPGAARMLSARLAQTNRPEANAHPMEHRPWGQFKRLAAGDRYQVKRITVKPGGATSLQKHHHRAEHWVVVAGTAEVTVGAETRLLMENEAAYLPLGAAHRLANPGKIPVELIEVQSGAYLGEDDIMRLDDPYQRDA